MVALELALGIFKSLLDLAIERAKYLPEDERAAHWARFEARIAPIERLIDKLIGKAHGN